MNSAKLAALAFRMDTIFIIVIIYIYRPCVGDGIILYSQVHPKPFLIIMIFILSNVFPVSATGYISHPYICLALSN